VQASIVGNVNGAACSAQINGISSASYFFEYIYGFAAGIGVGPNSLSALYFIESAYPNGNGKMYLYGKSGNIKTGISSCGNGISSSTVLFFSQIGNSANITATITSLQFIANYNTSTALFNTGSSIRIYAKR
jgi:hypothetical protein